MADRSSLSDYMKSLYQYKVLTREEERTLWDRMQKGDWRAEDLLVTHNLRFAVMIVKSMPQWAVTSIPREDLIQFANMGLMMAAKKWQPQANIKFASYAKRFIQRYVTRGVENTQNLIRIPVRVSEKIRKMLYTERRMTQQLQRSPTREELAEALEVKPKMVDSWRGILLREPSSLDSLTYHTNNILENEESS